MFGLGQLGRLGLTGGARWTPAKLWPLGAASPGLWIDPPYTSSMFQDSAGTTAISAIGTVLDTSNPVGLILDRKGGATVLADPGIHLSQATATSRPVASARVNLATYTEDVTNVAWVVFSATKTATGFTTDINPSSILRQLVAPPGGTSSITVTVSAKVSVPSGTAPFRLDCTHSAVLEYSSPEKLATTTPQRFSFTQTFGAGAGNGLISGGVKNSGVAPAVNTFIVTELQIQLGGLSDYQRVTTASDYDASAGPTYCDLDGTDDGWLSATFTADTDFTDGMDALIAVRRDSAANAVCGLYQSVAEANKVFGIAESGSGSGCVGSGAGTPTVLVDGTQLTGGTAVTRGTLHTALTPGAWHILEFRNLDLSTWTAIGFGLYTSYVLNGGYGGHKVFSNGQDANRDKARAQMAAYFGVTLP